MTSIGQMQEEAKKRKQRLLALKQRQKPNSQNDDNDSNEGAAESLPKPMFRSYKPQDENLKALILPRAKPGDVEDKILDQLEAATPAPIVDEVDLVNLAPRKPDWDLKRDIKRKLEKLDKRTQKAIAELIRDRIKQGKDDLTILAQSDASQMMNAESSDED